MGQKQMRYPLPEEAACRGVDMGQDESVLILLRHCRDMKRQETRLRLVTLLLLLGCAALFFFILLRENSGSSGRGSIDEPRRAKQEATSPQAGVQTNPDRLRIDLTSQNVPNETCPLFLKWEPLFGDRHYSEEKRAIRIPVNGFYFFYLKVFFCCKLSKTKEYDTLSVKLLKWNPQHEKSKPLTSEMESAPCKDDVFRVLTVGQLFYLNQEDHVRVEVQEGESMIIKSSFGAFYT
ncbi:uncharacterized protein LOC121525382 [Cheilinus undulatus]|uniref:uncharacterized protein LOC121525382 n=1 Tax=Cheilinus undulatus TaxID=241271 RepID=UPI001BD52C30|nr:uncharacterized protein LOC121525382 [Cheilinus undulatus]